MSAAEQRERQPPVLFVHMERDLRTAGSVANTLVELLAKVRFVPRFPCYLSMWQE